MKKLYNILHFDIKISFIFIILAIINFIVCIMYLGKLGTFLVDVSREVYIPFSMNSGNVLYKDIFNVYSPLAYQINAFITKIFSDNITTYYILGLINSTFILWGLYLIARLFFKENNKQIPFYFCLLILFCAVYAISITNYIFPYSYSMVYALNTYIWSLLSLLYYIKKGNEKYLYLSFILFGATISFKYEFIFFALILLYFLIKGTNIKQKALCIFSFIIIPVLSLINLFFLGTNIKDIYKAFEYMILLSKSESVHNLYSFLGFIPNLTSIKSIIFSFLSFLILCLILYIPYKLFYKFQNKLIKIGSIIIGLFILAGTNTVFIQSNAAVFNWIGIFFIMILIFFLLKNKEQIDTYKKMYIVLLISTLLVSIKSIFYIALNSYGSYYLPLIMLCCIIYLIKYTKKIKAENILYFIIIFAILFGISNNIRCKMVHNIGIPFQKGTIWVEDYAYEAIWKTYQYINKETKPTDKILVLPEGAMFNYLTNRLSDDKYYYLIPSNVEIFTEEKIANDMGKNLPEYIIIPPRYFSDYKETFFCESYGTKICKDILKYYSFVKIIKTILKSIWIN